MNNKQKWREVNEQTKQGKSKIEQQLQKTTQKMHNDYSDVSTGIWCFKGIFSLHIKEKAKQYQMQP